MPPQQPIAIPIEIFALVFLTIAGAIVGSFLNVVIYRVPAGLSVITPPSRCPGCEKKLAFYDNVPVLGWLWLRGKCRTCKMKISVQYPLVEAATALLFFAVTYVYYFTPLRQTFAPGVIDTWPVLGVHLVLVSMMVAVTMIDAKLYIIPLSLPWISTAATVLVLPLSVAAGWVPLGALAFGPCWEELIPMARSPLELGSAFGGLAGLGIAFALVRLKKLPLSFADEQEWLDSLGLTTTDPNELPPYPHLRREICKEALYFLFPLVGLVCLLYTSPSPRDQRGSRMPSSA